MNGYRTGGDWTDVTSIDRNEVVFEGRHKAYGAYDIRKRYPNALLFAFASALTFFAICAYIPYALRNVSNLVPKTDVIVTAKPTEVLLHRNIVVPPPPSHPQPPKGPINQHMPPVIVPQPIDSTPQPIANSNPVTVPGNPGQGDPSAPVIIAPDPGGNPLPPEVPDNSIKTWVSEMPKFPGGNVEDYLGKQLRYSAEDIQLGIEGTVYVSFVIEKDGSVSTVTLKRGVSGGPDLNNEAMRVISDMPKWTPGKQDGHPVRIQYMIPIHFKLK